MNPHDDDGNDHASRFVCCIRQTHDHEVAPIARKESNAEVRDQVVSRVKQRFNELRDFKQQRQAAAFEKYWNELQRRAMESPKSVNLNFIPPDEWNALLPSHRTQLQNRMQQISESRLPSMADEKTWRLYHKLHLMAYDPEKRKDFLKFDLWSASSELPPDRFETLHRLQLSMVAKASGDLSKAQKSEEVIRGFMTPATYASNKLAMWKIEKEDIQAKFLDAFNMSYADFKKRHGKEPDNKEMENMADKLLVHLRSSWGNKIRSMDIKYDDIPESDKDRIDQEIRRLRSDGLIPPRRGYELQANPQDILDYYLAEKVNQYRTPNE